jgi:hypothetical protein
MNLKTQEQQIGLALIGLGMLWLLTTVVGGDSGWLWIAAISAGFGVAYSRTRNAGFVVPCGVLAGVAVGVMLETLLPFDGSVFLCGLAGGFYAIRTLEPKIHAWAIYPTSILAAIAALIFVTQNALLIALVLVGAGAYLLTRNRPAKQIAVTDPAEQRRAALKKWRSSLAKLEGKDKAESLSDTQLEALISAPPATLEDLQGTLSTDQIARYGNQMLDVLRSVA